MKPYFTKYIPVEGEIKEGDYYIIEGLSLAIKLNTKVEEEFPLGCDNQPRTKVKLFLCSRDIKVGDEIYEEVTKRFGVASTVRTNEKGLITYVSIKYQPNQDTGWAIFPDKTLKVIGEISPDALGYVKEDMEYDEHSLDPLSLKYLHEIGGSIRPFIRVKGPCGHFH